MSDTLLCREATKKDRSALQRFTCTTATEETWQRRADGWWEYEVQGMVRQRAVNPLRRPGTLLVWQAGDETLVGVLRFVEDYTTDEPVQSLTVNLEWFAVALAHQNRGLGTVMLKQALRVIGDRAVAQGFNEVAVRAQVYHRNERSQAVNADCGLECTEPYEEVQEWVGRVVSDRTAT